ncbi:MAG: hypothetical protein IT162_01160 [Bryobacterales bacterium]|nr:hypothetical protein [Bryobacterales bacterium]
MPLALADFAAAHFASRLGETFVFERPDAPGEQAALVLLEVKELGASPAPGLRSPFSLLFELREGRALSVHPHRLLAGDLESCHLLVTRVADPARLRENPRGQFYEAVFA